MKKKKLSDALSDPEYIFKVKQLVIQKLVESGLNMDYRRFNQQVNEPMVQWLVKVLVQEETLAKYPSDWWQALKERWFPWSFAGRMWLRRWPVRYTEVMAVHKFPELSPPDEVLGREFVTLKLVDEDKLVKVGEEKKE